jgi:hypothetical protein
MVQTEERGVSCRFAHVNDSFAAHVNLPQSQVSGIPVASRCRIRRY